MREAGGIRNLVADGILTFMTPNAVAQPAAGPTPTVSDRNGWPGGLRLGCSALLGIKR